MWIRPWVLRRIWATISASTLTQFLTFHVSRKGDPDLDGEDNYQRFAYRGQAAKDKPARR